MRRRSAPGIGIQVAVELSGAAADTGYIPFPRRVFPGAIRDPVKESQSMFRSSSLRRRALALLSPAVVATGILLSAVSGVTAQQSATPTPIGLLQEQEAENLPECAPAEIGALPEGTDAATIYAIVPEESMARYRVQEELAQVGENEAV